VNFASLFSGLLLGYSLAVPPGPMNALIAAWSLRSFRHGFAVGAGAMSADFLLMLLTLHHWGYHGPSLREVKRVLPHA